MPLLISNSASTKWLHEVGESILESDFIAILNLHNFSHLVNIYGNLFFKTNLTNLIFFSHPVYDIKTFT